VVDGTDSDTGPRPSDLLLVAQAGCTAMDVISILRKKRQHMTHYEVRVNGHRRTEDHPHVFERIDVLHVVEGVGLDAAAVRRAITLRPPATAA
jgi:putative redox protein